MLILVDFGEEPSCCLARKICILRVKVGNLRVGFLAAVMDVVLEGIVE